MNKNEKPDEAPEVPFGQHLVELRTRLIRSLVVLGGMFLLLLPFASKLYQLFALPLINKLAEHGSSMITTAMVGPLLIPFKLTFYLVILITAPYLAFEAWCFIKPGLYQSERHFALPLLLAGGGLFYCGVAAGYFLVLPLLIRVMIGFAPDQVLLMTDIGDYLDFNLKLLFGFGTVFEVPVITFLSLKTGLITTDKLAKARPYVIAAAFACGMLLTPPDVVSQCFLAIPLWLFFELGLLAGRVLLPRANEKHPDKK